MRSIPSTVSNTGDRHQADHQHIERGHAPVHQHLVDDHLEEQRRDQREQLQEERRDQHFGQHAAVLGDRAEKPGDVEAPRQAGKSGAFADQDQISVPDLLQLLAPLYRRTVFARVLHQDAIFGRLRNDDEAAVAQRRDRGHRRLAQPFPLGRNAAHLDVERPCQPYDLGRVGRLVVPELVTQLLRIGCDPVETQQQHEARQAGVDRCDY